MPLIDLIPPLGWERRCRTQCKSSPVSTCNTLSLGSAARPSGLWAASQSYCRRCLPLRALRPSGSVATSRRCFSPISATNLLSTSTRRFPYVPEPTAYAAECRNGFDLTCSTTPKRRFACEDSTLALVAAETDRQPQVPTRFDAARVSCSFERTSSVEPRFSRT